MTFSERIAAIRKEMRISQEKFGELASVSQRTVAFWESGERMPSRIKIEDLAAKLNVSVDYLLGNTENSKLKEPAISDDELRANTYNRIKSLPEPVLEKVLDLIDAIQSYPGSGSASQAPHGSYDQDDP